MKKENYTIHIIATLFFLMLALLYAGSKWQKENSEMIVSLEKFSQLSEEGSQIIDVRTKDEYDLGHVYNSTNIDWYQQEMFKQEIANLPKDKTYLLYCRSGNRSLEAAKYMKDQGFSNVYSFMGGTDSGNLNLVTDNKYLEKPELPEAVIGETASLKTYLDLALLDEYKARDTYESVLKKYPNAKPFSNIINAEKQHINSLLSLYEKYNVDLPEYKNNTLEYKGTLQEACSIGVDAEILNAKLYTQDLLPNVKNHADIVDVFTKLYSASQNNHLPAFQKCS